MDFIQLQPEQRQSFEADGFLVVRNVLNRDEVNDLIEAGDRAAASFLSKPFVDGSTEYNQLDFRPGLLREECFRDLVTHAAVVPLVVQLLSPNIHLHSTALIYKRPENPEAPAFRRGWHRDIRIPRDLGHAGLPLVGIKICYCLTDFHESRSGMTLMARASHHCHGPLAIRRGDVDPVDYEVCDLQLNAGDALLFENRIYHTAAPNCSSRVSKVLIYGYAYRWMKPEVYLESPSEKLLESVDPVTRQLLGGYRDVDTRPWALRNWADRHGLSAEYEPWTVER